MSYRSKLLIAGLGFPTLLLIFAAVFVTWKLPQVKAIDELERRLEEGRRNPVVGQPVTFWTLLIRFDYPFVEESVKQFNLSGKEKVDWEYKWFGTVTRVHIIGNDCTNEDLDIASRLGKVETLQVWVKEFDESGFQHLSRLTRLTHFDISVQRTPGAEGGSAVVTDRGLEWIAQVKQLESLVVGGLNGVTAEGISKLKSLPELVSISLRRPGVSEEVMREILGIPSLKKVHFNGSDLPESTIRLLAADQRLSFECWDIQTTPAGFRALADVGGLERMRFFEKYPLPKDAFAGFPGKSRLTSLSIKSASLTAEMLARIAGIETLEELEIPNANITPADLIPFQNHPMLKRLLVPTHFSPAELKDLGSQLPGVEVTRKGM